MNKAAISDKRLAIGETLALSRLLWARLVWLIANCSSLIAASKAAVYCTVTIRVTSVTHRGLAGSVLIRVGKVYLEQGLRILQTAKDGGLALRYCSFREATCIQ